MNTSPLTRMSTPADLVVRAAVVDDEPMARDVVVSLLRDLPMVQVIGQAGNGRDAVALVRRERPDLLFLDIQMPDQDGFAVLDALGDEVPRGVVFVTAHDEHAVRAFEVHALDYVLKPFGKPRFFAAVSRALARLTSPDASSMHPTLESIAGDRRTGTESGTLLFEEDRPNEHEPPRTSPRPQARRLGVRTGSRTAVVEVESVDWVEASGDYARIHVGKQTHLVTQRMHELERLFDAKDFLRIHRSVIVNVNRIRELHRDADGGGTIVLHDGVRLRVARGRWGALERSLDMEAF